MTTKLALIGCGAAKNQGVLPAKDKYSSNYFGLKWNYGDVVCDYQRIISAKCGLINPELEIDDYNKTISDMSSEEREAWGKRVGKNIVSEISSLDLDDDDTIVEIHILLGKDYLEPIKEDLKWLETEGCELVYPFEGTEGIGEQMSVLKETVEEVRKNESPIEFTE